MPVQLADAVGALAQPQAHVGMLNFEGSSSAPSGSRSCTATPKPAKYRSMSALGNRSMPAGTGGVRGEHGAAAHGLQGLAEGQAVGLGELADALDAWNPAWP